MNKALSSLLLAVTAQTLAGSALAESPEKQNETQWYQADMVVFLNQTTMNGEEKWPGISPHTIPKNAIALKPAELAIQPEKSTALTELVSFGDPTKVARTLDIERDAFISLPYSAQLLQKQGNILDRQPGYKVLDRKAWIMPVEEGKSSKPVKIRAFNNTGQPSLLEGAVSVTSSRFLHVNVDLWYSELAQEGIASMLETESSDVDSAKDTKALAEKPIVQRELQLVTAPNGQPMKIARNFQLNESRRIRNSDQTQYLDSPVIGVLVKLTPYERPDQPLLPEMNESSSEKEPHLGILPGILEAKDS